MTHFTANSSVKDDYNVSNATLYVIQCATTTSLEYITSEGCVAATGILFKDYFTAELCDSSNCSSNTSLYALTYNGVKYYFTFVPKETTASGNSLTLKGLLYNLDNDTGVTTESCPDGENSYIEALFGHIPFTYCSSLPRSQLYVIASTGQLNVTCDKNSSAFFNTNFCYD